MDSAHTATLSVSYLSWINEELRKKVEQHKEEVKQSKLATRIKTVLASGISVVSICLLSLFA